MRAGTGRKSSRRRHPKLRGDWTTAKLAVIAEYLRSYTTALKRKPFKKAYIDAFAGTGYRDAATAEDADGTPQPPLLPDLAEEQPQALLEGSARLALKTQPPFDKYIFIERRRSRCLQLEELKVEFPAVADEPKVLRNSVGCPLYLLCFAAGSASGAPIALRIANHLLTRLDD